MKTRPRFLALTLVVAVLAVGCWLLGAPVAASQNGCFKCKYTYFPGNEIFDPWLLVGCTFSETAGDPWDCLMFDEDTCYDFGVCGDFIYV